ncbi:MAG: class I mannose-6-phosphate isomerase [Candidatus Hydrogenedentes bacterium]|nr:class I mannose-6-phosphate isomerase [Candidatus Hydrogenedentota bacterium]
MTQSLIQFDPAFFERIWGGHRFASLPGFDAPRNVPLGEAWLISDHPAHESRVSNGAWRGQTLHDLVLSSPDYLLGTHAAPTIHGRFPLLLKILDAAEVLSVQVHPDDEDAIRLGEPDVGKTEMWHVLAAEPDSALICGLDPAVTPEQFQVAVEDGTIQEFMKSIPAVPGTTAFVSAGTVHAIGAGILLAEIQQNSDITYRIYDWDRTDAHGRARELHLDKAAQVTRFGLSHPGASRPLGYHLDGAEVSVLGACKYFVNELISLDGAFRRDTGGRSFHIVMPRDGEMEIRAGEERCALQVCRAVMIPAGAGPYTITGTGKVLNYYVPDLEADLVRPLRAAGHSSELIGQLGVIFPG